MYCLEPVLSRPVNFPIYKKYLLTAEGLSYLLVAASKSIFPVAITVAIDNAARANALSYDA